jgi:microcystin-dependent protein
MSFYNVDSNPLIRSRNMDLTGRQDITSSVGSIALVMSQNGLLPPPGSIFQYAGSVSPVGYFVCDGSAVSRTYYEALFLIIGTIYGSGDGSTTFNLPNLKGKFPVGYDSSQTEFDNLNESGGAKTHTLTIAEMPSHNHNGLTQSAGSHTHAITDPGHTHSYVNQSNTQNTDNAFATETAADNSSVGQTTGSSITNISINLNGAHQHIIDSQGGGQSHNNLPPYLVLNYIIKY